MSLADLAAADFQSILNEDGCVITLRSPDGREATLSGNEKDVSHAVNPETGAVVSARQVSIVVSMADLRILNMAPRGESDVANKKPWVVRFTSAGSAIERTWRVMETIPDETIGALVLILEFYKSQP